MTRVMLMTFLGEKRWLEGVHPHESPLVMTVPLIILGVGSVFGGLVLNNWISGWLDPAVGGEPPARRTGLLHFSAGRRRHPARGGHRGRRSRSSSSVRASRSRPRSRPAGRRSPWPVATTSTATPSTRRCSCDPGSGSPTVWCGSTTTAIDGTVVDGTATVHLRASRPGPRRIQNGFVRSYAATMVVGAGDRRRGPDPRPAGLNDDDDSLVDHPGPAPAARRGRADRGQGHRGQAAGPGGLVPRPW